MSAADELQKAMFERLVADPAVAALVDPDRILDRQADRVVLPHIIFSGWETADWSTSTEAGESHRVTLDIWSGENGRLEARVIASAVVAALHDAGLGLATHHLVNLRLERMTSMRDPRSRRHRASLRFRAVTEAP